MVLLLSSAFAMNSIEEGPWQVFACIDAGGACQAGTFLGEAWATNPNGASAWAEYGERTASWSFVTSSQPWFVSVPATAGTLTCPNGTVSCHKVAVTTTSTFRPKPAYGDPSGGFAAYPEWHPNGKYEVTAYVSTTGARVVGTYYVSGQGETRSERLCTPNGFLWPGRSDAAGDPVVTWRIKYLDASAPPANCPGGWKTWDFTVDLTP